jgi:hypothetical protein
MIETDELIKLADRLQRLKALKAQLAEARQPGALACKRPLVSSCTEVPAA